MFIPLLFMGGIIGRLFREFAVDGDGRGAYLGLHLADPDAGDVLAVPEARAASTAPRAAQPLVAERVFEAVLGVYDRGLNWVLRHQSPTLLATSR